MDSTSRAQQSKGKTSTQSLDLTTRQTTPAVLDASRRATPQLACDYCHKKKIKCQEQRPCRACVSLDMACVVSRTVKRATGLLRREYIASLEQRLADVESRLANANMNSGQSPSTSKAFLLSQSGADTTTVNSAAGSTADVSSASNSTPKPAKPEDIELLMPSPAFSSRQPSPILKATSMSSFATASGTTTDQASAASNPFDDFILSELDFLHLNETYIDYYFDNVHLAFPVMPKHIFLRISHAVPQFYLACLYAYGALYSAPEDLNQPRYIAGIKYYEHARTLVDWHIDYPSVLACHGLFTLGMYSVACGKINSAWTFLGMAIRMAIDLELHLDTETIAPELTGLPPRFQKEIKRRIWWLIYIVDFFVSASNNTPRWTRDQDIRCPLPAPETLWIEGMMMTPDAEAERDLISIAIMSSNEDFVGGFAFEDVVPAHIMSTRIHGRICKYIRELSLGVCAKEHLDAQFYSLENSLKAWKDALPSWAAPDVDQIYALVPLHNRYPLPWIYAQLKMNYHLLNMMLYKSELVKGAMSLPTARSMNAYERLKESAHAMTFLTGLFLRDNPTFSGVGPYICSCIYEAGLSWLSIAKYSAANLEMIAFCDQNLVILIRALDAISKTFIVAKDQRDQLQRMRRHRFAVRLNTVTG